jgi:hypothetical protein
VVQEFVTAAADAIANRPSINKIRNIAFVLAVKAGRDVHGCAGLVRFVVGELEDVRGIKIREKVGFVVDGILGETPRLVGPPERRNSGKEKEKELSEVANWPDKYDDDSIRIGAIHECESRFLIGGGRLAGRFVYTAGVARARPQSSCQSGIVFCL